MIGVEGTEQQVADEGLYVCQVARAVKDWQSDDGQAHLT